MKNNDTNPQAQVGSPIYLCAKQKPVTPQMRISISNADVYLLNWHLLASEHCDSTPELHPVNMQPNLIHQFIIYLFYWLDFINWSLYYAVALCCERGCAIFAWGMAFL
jgi:hypothetical protein